MRLSKLLSLAILCLLPVTTQAETTRLKTAPDGQIRFDVSISGPTRVSVVGDRIAKVLQSQSLFEMVNDEDTGDVFLRFAGGAPETESGYIVTESGVTIGFTMTPRVDLEMQTVLVTITGTRPGTSGSAAPSGFAVNAAARGPSSASKTTVPTGETRTDRLVEFVRQTHARRIGDRSPARLRSGIHSRYSSDGLKAEVRVGAASGGQAPHPSTFSKSKQTLAVWVDDAVRSGKVWVIVVEGKL